MTLANLIDLMLVVAIAGGGLGAWRLHRRLQAFRATMPEFQAEIAKLNASIAAAQDALARMHVQAVRLDSVPHPMSRITPAAKPETRPKSALASLMAAMTRDAA